MPIMEQTSQAVFNCSDMILKGIVVLYCDILFKMGRIRQIFQFTQFVDGTLNIRIIGGGCELIVFEMFGE